MNFANVTCSCGHSFSADISKGFCFCDNCGRRLEMQPAAPDTETDAVAAPAPQEPEDDLPIEMTSAPEEINAESFGNIPAVPVEPDYSEPAELPEAEPAAIEAAPVTAPEPVIESEPVSPAVPEAPVQPVQPPVQPPIQSPAPQPAPAPAPVYVAPPTRGVPGPPAQNTAYNMPPGAPGANPFGYAAPTEPKADLAYANQYLNTGNLKGAEECLELLKVSDPHNPEVWFANCRLLAAKKPINIQAAIADFLDSARRCLALDEGYRGKLTPEFNRFIDNMISAISMDRLYICQYDSSQLSEPVPSVNYQPYAYVDAYYSILMDCIDRFRAAVNPAYRNDYFLASWDKAYFTFAHAIVQKLVGDVNHSNAFYWYKVNIKNRSHDDTPLRALCEVIYGYKAAFIKALGRTPYRDAKAQCVNRIVFLNNWLLKMKYLNQNGVFALLVAAPAQRAELERESLYYRQVLARS